MKKIFGIIPLTLTLIACDTLEPTQQYAQNCAESYINKLAVKLDASVISVKATNIRKVPEREMLIHDIESEVFSNSSNTVIKLPQKDFQCYTSEEEFQKYQQRITSEEIARKLENEKREKVKQTRLRLAAEEKKRVDKERQEITKRNQLKEKEKLAKQKLEKAYQTAVNKCKEEAYTDLLKDLKSKSKSYSTSTDGYDLKAERPKNINVGGKFNAVLTAKISNTIKVDSFVNYTSYKINVTCEI
jgi:ribosomal protein L16 Arg81 hydroxylase